MKQQAMPVSSIPQYSTTSLSMILSSFDERAIPAIILTYVREASISSSASFFKSMASERSTNTFSCSLTALHTSATLPCLETIYASCQDTPALDARYEILEIPGKTLTSFLSAFSSNNLRPSAPL